MKLKINSYPTISIITPSFNQGKFIEETIKSVVEQEYPNLEYVIKDARSTDNSLKIIQKYAAKYPKIIKWVSKEDKGQTDGINQGIKMATGEIIAYLNSDDLYLPNTFQTVAEYFTQHPEAQWVTGDYFIIDEEGRKIQSFVATYKRLLRRNPTFTKLAIANYIIQPSTFWRRSMMKKIGTFDASLRYCMDYDYWMRAINQSPPHVINRHFSLFRIHQASKGGTQYKRQFEEEHRVLKRYTSNSFLLSLHKLHAAAIILAYQIIK